MRTAEHRRLVVRDLGRKAYEPVLELQIDLVGKRREGAVDDTLLLVEHEPVYTLGLNATEDDVLLPAQELEERGIRVIRTGRGGLVTYHGPGQLVGYPVIKLESGRQGPVWYVSCLEKVLMRVIALHGIRSYTDRLNRGVWVGDRKVAAIGVRITGRVTMHGFALNVANDLSPYKGIVPCGIRDKGVTSMRELAPGVEMEKVKSQVVESFVEVFGYGKTEIVK